MKNRDPRVLRITQGAAIAALYVVLTMVFAPISFGPVQLRIAEALCILPIFTPAAIPGLFIGCVIANLIGGGIILDVIFGSLATLIGAVIGYMLRLRRGRCSDPYTYVPDPAWRNSGMLRSRRAALHSSSEEFKAHIQ